MKAEKRVVTVRLSVELHERLRRLAAETGRSMNRTVVGAILAAARGVESRTDGPDTLPFAPSCSSPTGDPAA